MTFADYEVGVKNVIQAKGHDLKDFRVTRKEILAALRHEAIENAVDAVENVIYQRALGGYTIAAIFYVKAQRPKFRDRLNIIVEQVQSEIAELFGAPASEFCLTRNEARPTDNRVRYPHAWNSDSSL